MKTKLIISTSVLFFTCIFSSAYAQLDTKGTDFWLTFGLNDDGRPCDLQIRIVGNEQPTTGTIYFTDISTPILFSIAAGEVFTHNLNATEQAAVINTVTGTTNRSVHITSDEPVTVYALNQALRTTDATNVLPVTALGTNYYQISYLPYPSFSDAYAVVATANNTVINHNGSPVATINIGQVYYFRSAANTDMTGANITTDEPAAFFVVNQGGYVPVGHTGSDHMFQQLAPVNTWGKNFFVPVSHLGKDIIRIVASQNGTNITQTGGTLLSPAGGQTTLNNLNAGQWVELDVQLANNGCFIQSNNPIGVCTYLTSTSYFSGSTSDPAMAWLPAIEQSVNSALIAPFVPAIGSSSNLNAHFAMIITPTNTKNSTKVSIKGAAATSLFGGSWIDHSSGNSFYSMPLTVDTVSYLFTNSEGGLFVMGYGTGLYESYYYTAASAMRNLDISFTIQEKATSTYTHYIMTNTNAHTFKYGDTIFVNRTVEKGFTNIHWLINGDTSSISENLSSSTNTLKFPASELVEGANTITMSVRFIGAMDDSLYTGTVWYSMTDYDTVCEGEIVKFVTTVLINGGTSPIYQWQVNGQNVGTNDTTFSYIPTDGDTVTCILISNEACVDPDTVVSQRIIITVNPYPILSSDIITENIVCVGLPIIVQHPVHGGVWNSNNDNVTISYLSTNSATVTGVTEGKTYITYTVSNGKCQTKKTKLIKVLPNTPPTVIIGIER